MTDNHNNLKSSPGSKERLKPYAPPQLTSFGEIQELTRFAFMLGMDDSIDLIMDFVASG